MYSNVPFFLMNDGVQRHYIRRGSMNPKIIVVSSHGGHDDENAAVDQANRYSAQPDLLVCAPQALMSLGSGGIPEAHWIHPLGQGRVEGLPDTTDFTLHEAIFAELAVEFPGVPIFPVGYSGGAFFWEDYAHSRDLSALTQAWALVHHTPIEAMLTPSGAFSPAAPLPPLTLVLTEDDTVAHQDPPNMTFDAAWACWADTYGVSLGTWENTGSANWQKQNLGPLLLQKRHTGNHQWAASGQIDERVVAFFRNLAGV